MAVAWSAGQEIEWKLPGTDKAFWFRSLSAKQELEHQKSMKAAWNAETPDDEWFAGLADVIGSVLVRVDGFVSSDWMNEVALDHLPKIFWATASCQRLAEDDAKKSVSLPVSPQVACAGNADQATAAT